MSTGLAEGVTKVPLTKKQRRRRAEVWLVWSVLFTLWMGGSLDVSLQDVSPWLVVSVLVLISVPAFVIYMVRTKTEISPEVAKATMAFTLSPEPEEIATKPTSVAEPFEVSDVDTAKVTKDIFGSAWMRYPIAALCFGIAFLLPNTIDVSLRIAIGLMLVCLGLYLSREVMLWVAGLALAGLVIWVLFVGFSALTVPAAIIVGALIIAFASRR